MTLTKTIIARAIGLGLAGVALTGAGQFPIAAIAAGQLAGTDRVPMLVAAIDAPEIVDVDTVTAPRPARLATLVAEVMDGSDSTAADAERACLARAVYFEARGEPLEGQLAVAQVILNRVASGRYADTVCGVITQRGQFTFDHDRTPAASRDWRTAKAIAAIAHTDDWTPVAPKATAFHATRVAANWNMRKVGTIGNHVFYR